MSSTRSELESKIREHFQDKAAVSVETMSSDGIDRVNEDIETSLDENAKERLKATRDKLLGWQVQLAQPLSSDDVTTEKASATTSSSSVTVFPSRPLVSSSFNEDVVLPRRPEGSTFGGKDGFLGRNIYGLCMLSLIHI